MNYDIRFEYWFWVASACMCVRVCECVMEGKRCKTNVAVEMFIYFTDHLFKSSTC